MNTAPADIRNDIKVGEADAGLDIDTNILGSPLEPFVMTPEKRTYIATLPSTAILSARGAAYRKHNARLELEAKTLQSQSGELESQLRKIVSLSTGIPEDKVDGMVDGLIAAVASEGGDDVEVGRVREFLRRVEGEGGD
jgi:regulatory protein SWI6